MAENIYNNLSKFSLSSILYRFLFDMEPDRVWLSDKSFLIQPMGVHSGIVFYNHLCSSIFEKMWIDYFHDTSNPDIINKGLYRPEFIDTLFRVINDVYVLDSTDSIYDLLQKSNLKQIRYFLYIIKKQNFTYYNTHQLGHDAYDSVVLTVERMTKLLCDYNKNQQNDGKTKTVDIDGVEYNVSKSNSIKFDYTTQFYKDYVIGNDRFYTLLINNYINKFISIADKVPYFLRNDDPQYWCKINNDKCIQSCRWFDPACQKRFIKKYSYLPFRSLYILPQLVSLIRSFNREWELDNLIRGVLYAINSSFSRENSSQLKALHKIDHNEPIAALLDRNKIHIIQSLFGKLNFSDIENEVRSSLGLTENKEDTFENLNSVIVKIYNFMLDNKTTFTAENPEKLAILTDFLDNHFRSFAIDRDYTGSDFTIESDADFTEYVTKISSYILQIDNMLMRFPNDLKNLDSMVSGLLKKIREAKRAMGKVGGQQVINPRETLLVAESVLHKRIAVDDELYKFYQENNRTKYVNSVLFWKFVIAMFYVSEIFLHLDENHAIQKMNFNEI